MVKAVVDLDERANRLVNIVKAKHGLRDKSQAINKIILDYEQAFLEPQLRPEFVDKMKERGKEEAIRVEDLARRYEAK